MSFLRISKDSLDGLLALFISIANLSDMAQDNFGFIFAQSAVLSSGTILTLSNVISSVENLFRICSCSLFSRRINRTSSLNRICKNVLRNFSL